MAKAAQIQARIKEIRKELDKGSDRAEILEKFGKKWKVQKSSIDNYIKAAKELIKADSKRVQALSDKNIQQVANDATIQTLSVARKRQLLSDIAEGKLEIPLKKPVWDHAQKKYVFVPMLELPDHAARMKAIEIDNKMSGDNSPEEVINYNSVDLTADEIKQYRKAIEDDI